jgi:hypothetical protein
LAMPLAGLVERFLKLALHRIRRVVGLVARRDGSHPLAHGLGQ